MKHRIFINMHYMEIGGAERALLGLLNAIDTDRVDVDLFINQHTGEFMKLIPEKINLLPEISTYSVIEKTLVTAIKKGHIGIAVARLIAKFIHRFHSILLPLKSPSSLKQRMNCDDYSIFSIVAKCTTPLLPSLKKYGEYDLAISFLTPHNIVKDKVKAKKKIAWIHTDYATVSIDAKREFPIWESFNHIISISPDVTESFLQIFPSLEKKIIAIENILSPTFIKQQASLFSPKEYTTDCLKILSIGRFCYQKNFESIPFIAKILKDRSLKFKWYIIGYGDSSEIIENICGSQTEDNVIILGKKENPYPYIANCDIYVQPSRYEGKSVTVREAQILCKPVVITNYPTAGSQVVNGVDGMICDMNNQSVAGAIYRFAMDKNNQEKICSYLSTHDYGNENEIDKIYALL